MKNKVKILSAFIIGVIVSAVSVYAAVTASSITYSNTVSGLKDANGNDVTTVQGAIDVLTTKSSNVTSYEKYLSFAGVTFNNGNVTFPDGYIIYYNPLTDSGCTRSEWNPSNLAEASVANSATTYVGNKTNDSTKTASCMRWFAYADDGGSTVKLLLDHNTGSSSWDSSLTTFTASTNRVYQYLQGLISTSGWAMEIESSNGEQTEGATVLTIMDAYDLVKVTNYKGTTGNDWDGNTAFYLGSNTSNYPSTYSIFWWLNDRLYNCTSKGCRTKDNSASEYWTKTPRGSTEIWYIGSNQDINSYNYGVSTGVRPVVIVPKSKLV